MPNDLTIIGPYIVNNPLLTRCEDEAIPDDIQYMLDNPGIYLCGNTGAPNATIPIASTAGALFSLTIGSELDPTRFLDQRTISGPFLKETATITQLKAKLAKRDAALVAIHSDLLMRGEKDSEGIIVVDVGCSVWAKVCDALPPTDSEGE